MAGTIKDCGRGEARGTLVKTPGFFQYVYLNQIRTLFCGPIFPDSRGPPVVFHPMISKKILLNGGIILLVCLAFTLPAAAIELNPISYFVKQPVAVQTANKTMVNHAIGPVERSTILPLVTSTVSPVDIPTMSHVSSGTGTCSQDTPITTLEGVVTEIMYADTWGTSYSFMKLSGGGDVMVFPADGGDRARVNHLLETAYVKGNRIHVITTSGCSMESFSAYDGINKQYPAYKILIIDLGPVHP